MNTKTIKDLGYIYYVTEWRMTIKREYIHEITKMGNYTIILAENIGLLTFHKAKGVTKGGKIYYLNTKTLLNEYKKYCKDKSSYFKEEKERYLELYAKAKLEESRYTLNFQEMNVAVQEFFTEDKKRIVEFNRNNKK